MCGQFPTSGYYFFHHMYVLVMSCGWIFGILGISARGPFFFNSLVKWRNVSFTWKGYKNQK